MTLDFEDDSKDIEVEVVPGVKYTVSADANVTAVDTTTLIIPQSDGNSNAWHVDGNWLSSGKIFWTNRVITIPNYDFTLETLAVEEVPLLTTANINASQPLSTGQNGHYVLEKGETYQFSPRDRSLDASYPRSTTVYTDLIQGAEFWWINGGDHAISFAGEERLERVDNGNFEFSKGYLGSYTGEDFIKGKQHYAFITADEVGVGQLTFSHFAPSFTWNNRLENTTTVYVIEPITDLQFSNSLNQVQYDKTIVLEDYLTFSPQDTSETAIKWEILSNTDPQVTIDANGNLYTGSNAGTITVRATATGYAKDAAGDLKAGSIIREITINATRDPDIYNVTFNPMGGSFIDANQEVLQTNNQGYLTTLPQLADRAGMVFSGWYLDPGLNVRFSTDTLIANDSTVYAGWAQGNYSKVEFDANPPVGGSATTAPQFRTIANGTAFGTLPIDIPTAKDINGKALVFAGWYPNADGSGDALMSATIINASTTYYAKWEAPRSTNGDIGWSVIEEVLNLGSPDTAKNPANPNSGITETWTEEGVTDEDAGNRDLRYFEVEIEGQPLAVGSDIIIVLDKSTSMENGTRWEDAVDAVDVLAKQLFGENNQGEDNYNRVALVQFSGNTRSSFNFQNSWDGFNINFKRTQPNYNAQVNAPADDDDRAAGDGTNYTTALRQALEIIGSRSQADSARPVHLIFVSDGTPEAAYNAEGELITLLDGSQITVNSSVVLNHPNSRTDQNVVEALGLTGEKEAATLNAMGVNSYAVGIELAPSKYLTAIANGQQGNVFTDVNSQDLTDILTKIGDSVIAYNQQAHISYDIAAAFPNHTIIDASGDNAEKPAWENGVKLANRPANTDFSNADAGYQINGSTITFDVNSIPKEGLTLGFYAEYTPEDPPVPPVPPTPPTPPVKPPTPPVTPPDEPPAIIEEPPTPLAGGVDIQEVDTPLGDTPDIIITEETPLGQLPQTGAIGISAGNLLLAALSALAIFGLSFKKRK